LAGIKPQLLVVSELWVSRQPRT